MKDVWMRVLQSIEPEYEKLAKMIYEGPYIKPKLYHITANRCKLTLEEVWPEDVKTQISNHTLDTRISWVMDELSRWPGVKRVSWDSWEFSNKRAAEKFLTIYHITWDK